MTPCNFVDLPAEVYPSIFSLLHHRELENFRKAIDSVFDPELSHTNNYNNRTWKIVRSVLTGDEIWRKVAFEVDLVTADNWTGRVREIILLKHYKTKEHLNVFVKSLAKNEINLWKIDNSSLLIFAINNEFVEEAIHLINLEGVS